MVGEKLKLLEKSEISLLLDTYDDIFSDFDPRPFSKRALSDDFLYEAKKAAREKEGGTFELRFLIPDNVRNRELEKIIQKRLHEHFKKHAGVVEKELSETVVKGILALIVGFSVMVGTALLNSYTKTFVTNMLTIVLEPAGWFSVWLGFDHIFYNAKAKKPEVQFYKKMKNAEIIFETY